MSKSNSKETEPPEFIALDEAAAMTKSLAAAWLLHAASAADYWMAWPDHYARGGGLGNQLEQMLGRVQCAGDAKRTMVLPNLRADRSSMRGDARHHAGGRVAVGPDRDEQTTPVRPLVGSVVV